MYEKDYGIFWRAFQPVLIIIPIILFCSMLADGVSAPVQSMLGGATGQQIHDTSNMYFLRSHLLWILLSIIGIYTLSFILLSYLEGYHDDDGIIPYKRDLNGRKIRKTFIKHPYINKCYDTYDEFMRNY